MTVKDVKMVCDTGRIMRVDKVIKQYDDYGEKIENKLIYDDEENEEVFSEQNADKDVVYLRANYDGEVDIFYTNENTEYPKTIRVLSTFEYTSHVYIKAIYLPEFFESFVDEKIDYVAPIYLSAKGDDTQKTLNDFYKYVEKVATTFKTSIKFVVLPLDSIEKMPDEGWKKEFVKTPKAKYEVLTKIFNEVT